MVIQFVNRILTATEGAEADLLRKDCLPKRLLLQLSNAKISTKDYIHFPLGPTACHQVQSDI